ncbi:MAG: hypothetical protein JO040_03200, partial [Gemmatimonadetes bacterium]|nr:hypothetical protein [Gemmatimonadota bacterium]
MKRTFPWVLTACFAWASLAVGCGRSGLRLAGAATDTVYVGVAVGLTTPSRYVGVYNGVQLALDELNQERPEGAPPLALRRAPAEAKSALEIAAAFRDDP